MTKDQKEFAMLAAGISGAAGGWLFIEGITYGGMWRLVGGLIFIVFGIIRITVISMKKTEQEKLPGPGDRC